MEITLINYNHITGEFSRKPRSVNDFNSERTYKMWVKRFANESPCRLNDKGYLRIFFNGKDYFAHRVAWFLYYGVWPVNQIDHINQIKTDNRIDNLREVSNEENCKNQTLRKTNKSGRIGVYFDNQHKKWRASIRFNNKTVHLGLSKNIEEIINLRKDAEIKYGYHKNHGRVKNAG